MIPVDPEFLPVSALESPRFAGIATTMRLPAQRSGAEIGFLGVPWDGGTTNRPGARHGPRALRDASTMIRSVNQATRVAPFHSARCTDAGDAPVNPVDIASTLAAVESTCAGLLDAGTRPIVMGGDHLVSLPVLRAAARANGAPLGLVHFDSHTDLFGRYFGDSVYTHGTPFRLAVEEGLLDPGRMIQIGIRGSAYDGADRAFAAEHGIRVVTIEALHRRGLDDVMIEARERIGDRPCWLSFDIDVLDPSVAPGTGTPEIGGLSSFEAQRLVRRLEGAHVVGADLVEVSPPFDVGGLTALAGANLLFEILCVLATDVARRAGRAPVWCETLPADDGV